MPYLMGDFLDDFPDHIATVKALLESEISDLRAKCAQLEAAYKNELLRRTRVEEKITALIDAFTDLGVNVRMDDE